MLYLVIFNSHVVLFIAVCGICIAVIQANHSIDTGYNHGLEVYMGFI